MGTSHLLLRCSAAATLTIAAYKSSEFAAQPNHHKQTELIKQDKLDIDIHVGG